MFSILKKSVLIVFEISFILTVINNVVTGLIQLFQIMVVKSLVSFCLHFLYKHFSLWTNVTVYLIRTFGRQRLQQSRPMILCFSNISFFNLTDNEYLLSFVKVLDFASPRLEVIVVSVKLKEMFRLLANYYFIGWSSQTNTSCFLYCFTRESELRFKFTNNGGVHRPCMDTNTYLEICRILQVYILHCI